MREVALSEKQISEILLARAALLRQFPDENLKITFYSPNKLVEIHHNDQLVAVIDNEVICSNKTTLNDNALRAIVNHERLFVIDGLSTNLKHSVSDDEHAWLMTLTGQVDSVFDIDDFVYDMFI